MQTCSKLVCFWPRFLLLKFCKHNVTIQIWHCTNFIESLIYKTCHNKIWSAAKIQSATHMQLLFTTVTTVRKQISEEAPLQGKLMQ